VALFYQITNNALHTITIQIVALVNLCVFAGSKDPLLLPPLFETMTSIFDLKHFTMKISFD